MRDLTENLARPSWPLLVVAAALFAGWLPSQAHAAKPELVPGGGSVTQTEPGDDAIFSIKVIMGKRRSPGQKVSVTYAGTTYKTTRVEISRSYWDTDPVSVPRRDCYRVFVRAQNRSGTTTETIRLGRRGTDGCR